MCPQNIVCLAVLKIIIGILLCVVLFWTELDIKALCALIDWLSNTGKWLPISSFHTAFSCEETVWSYTTC